MPDIARFRCAPETFFGAGSVKMLPVEIKKFSSSAFIVMDPGLDLPGLLPGMEMEGVEFTVFREVEPEPWVETADAAGEALKKSGAGCVVGIGGGSAMDIAKAASVLATNPGTAADYQGLNLVRSPGLPGIMVPTTAGSGSEATFTAVLSTREPKSKAGINSPFLYPVSAVLDPELTAGLPPRLTATTGMDALAHAIEAYTSLAAGPLSDMAAINAVRLISGSLRKAVADGSDIAARADMLLGSFLGGVALASAGVGAVHALSYPLGGVFRVPHGAANGLLLPHVMRFNEPGCPKYSSIAEAMGAEGDVGAADAVAKLAGDAGIPLTLSSLGIRKEHFNAMAEAAMKVSRPLENNPRKVTAADALKIYEEAF